MLEVSHCFSEIYPNSCWMQQLWLKAEWDRHALNKCFAQNEFDMQCKVVLKWLHWPRLQTNQCTLDIACLIPQVLVWESYHHLLPPVNFQFPSGKIRRAPDFMRMQSSFSSLNKQRTAGLLSLLFLQQFETFTWINSDLSHIYFFQCALKYIFYFYWGEGGIPQRGPSASLLVMKPCNGMPCTPIRKKC